MKSIIKMFTIALGVMVMCTSCGAFYGAQGYYGYGNYGNYGYSYRGGTLQTTPNPNGLYVSSRNLQKSGTFVVGKTSYPTQLRWQNMSLIKNGLMVYVYDGNGQLLNQYDLRLEDQGIDDVYRPIGLTGKALSVSVCITGGVRGFNAVLVFDGDSKETYYL